MSIDQMSVDLPIHQIRTHQCDYMIAKGPNSGQICTHVITPPYNSTNTIKHLGDTYYYCKRHLDSGKLYFKNQNYFPQLKEHYYPIEQAFLEHVRAHLDKIEVAMEEQKKVFEEHYDVTMLWIQAQRKNVERITKIVRENLVVKISQSALRPEFSSSDLKQFCKTYVDKEFTAFLETPDYKTMEAQITVQLKIQYPNGGSTATGDPNLLTGFLTERLQSMSMS